MKTFVMILSICALSLSISSCRKYEEGSNFSLLGKKLRLTGDWMLYEVTDAYGNDVDLMNHGENLSLNYDGTFDKTVIEYYEGSAITTSRFSGSWRFVDDKESLALINNRENIDIKYTIVRLTNSELKIRDDVTKSIYYYVPL
jgi:hypothetical protein